MKKLLLLTVLCGFQLFAADMEMIAVDQKVENAEKKLYDAMTQIDINGASSEYSSAIHEQTMLIFERKFLSCSDPLRRKELLRELWHLSSEVQKIWDESWKYTGSGEVSFRNSHEAAKLIFFQNVWKLPEAKEKIWRQICNAKGDLNVDFISFNYGIAELSEKEEDESRDEDYEDYSEGKFFLNRCIYLDMDDVFVHNDKIFAVCQIDLPGALNDDFASLVLVVFKGNKIVAVEYMKDEEVYLKKWDLNKNILNVYGDNEEKYTFDLDKF